MEAKARGYLPGRFSFNVKGGRCENCSGDGTIKIEMNFLPDVYVACEVCGGARYNRDTLAVHYKGKNIAEVLDMPISEAAEFFEPISAIHRFLKTLVDVGLGYVRLGQSATTLSGGEAQRVKLATELQKRSNGRSVYVLDEPTTGLHFEDVRKLLLVLNGLVDKGNTVIVIEHNLDVIKSADWLIDLGPEGGSGRRQGRSRPAPPRRSRSVEGSHTGLFLARAARPASERLAERRRWRRPRATTVAWRPKAGEIPTAAGRLPLPRRDRPRALRRQGQEPPLAPEQLLPAAPQPARAHAAHGARPRASVEWTVVGSEFEALAARVHLDQGVRPAVQRQVPRRQVLPVPRDHARRRACRA